MTDANAPTVAPTVQGSCAEEYDALRDLLATNLASGDDLGAAVAVVRDGELVADLWGGEARPGVPWTADTLVQVWSVSKVMAGLAFLVLADRGEIDLDAPVATYWPDFAAHGKDEVRVHQLLSHSCGVPGWSAPLTVEEFCDLEASEALLAAEAPWYEPGSGIAYQILSHGHLLDAVTRGATGRALADVLHEEVMAGVDGDFFLGVPEDRLDDCADLAYMASTASSFDLSGLPPDSMLVRTLFNPPLGLEVVNSTPWRRAAIGAAGGHGTARGIALAQATLYAGAVGDATLERIWSGGVSGTDQVLYVPLTYSMGYGLPGPSAPAVPEGRVCWWTGWGGAIVVNDTERRTTIAYTPNQLALDHLVTSPRTEGYVRTALGVS